jgi:hypothetical protein
VGKEVFQVGIAIVLAGAVVLVVGPSGRQLFQPFPDVFVQAPLIVLDDDRSRQVHGRDKAEPFLDARFFHLGSHQRRQVHNVPPPRRLHPQISRMRTHWTKMRESPVKSQSQTPEGHHKK